MWVVVLWVRVDVNFVVSWVVVGVGGYFVGVCCCDF